MKSDMERREREERAARLVEARKDAGFRGPQAVADRFGFNVNTYKAHEAGRNGFGIADAKEYAKAFKVSLNWLNFGIGSKDDPDEPVEMKEVKLISWGSAGALVQPETSISPEDLEYAPTVFTTDLDASGDWIALRVDGDSMNRISPHDSIIFVNRRDRKLVPNACYIIADGEGGATYKRYRPPNTWEPVSTNPAHRPMELPDGQHPEIIGRVRKTVLAM
mgnify:CR=1 FL=1